MITSDFTSYGYWIALTIQDKTGKKVRVLVQNGVLYDYFNEKKNMEKASYWNFIRPKLINDETLSIEDTIPWQKGFFKYIKNKRANKIAKKGKEYFINYYFHESGELNHAVEKDNLSAILMRLYDWNIPIRTDDMSGDFFVVKSFNCNKLRDPHLPIPR